MSVDLRVELRLFECLLLKKRFCLVKISPVKHELGPRSHPLAALNGCRTSCKRNAPDAIKPDFCVLPEQMTLASLSIHVGFADATLEVSSCPRVKGLEDHWLWI